MIDTILFDLDGTLLCMDQDEFTKSYFEKLCYHMSKYGWDPKEMYKTIWAGCKAMILNDGSMSNEARFWETFYSLTGKRQEDVAEEFEQFYLTGFQTIIEITSPMEESAAIVALARAKGYKVALATSPLFPSIATHSRVRWAGMEPEMFSLVTTYENSSFTKPNLKYYEEVLASIDADASHTLMVGNDVKEDMCAGQLGMETYLVTDYLVDRENVGVEGFRHGTLHEFYQFVKALPDVTK